MIKGVSTISPFVAEGKLKVCVQCGGYQPAPYMLAQHPVPGLTVWLCSYCQQKQQEGKE